MTFANGDAGVSRLRLFNPTDSDAVAIVGGSRIIVSAGAIVERSDLVGDAVVRSSEELIVTERISDVSAEDAPNATHDVQLAATDLQRPYSSTLVVRTQACGTTTLATTSSVVCQQGTSTAMVAAIPGATYEWSAANAQILNGQGTNMVTLSFGFASNASVSVVVKTPDGCSLSGAATITVRTAFTPLQLSISPSSPRVGDSVTVSWRYSTTETPRTQTLTLTSTDGTARVITIPITERSYTFVTDRTGSWDVTVFGSLAGAGRRRSVRMGNSTLPAPSPCFSGSTSVPFTVTDPCNAPSATVSAPASVAPSATFTASMPAGAASYSWNVSNGTILSGQGTNVVSVRAGSSGSVSLSGTASNGTDCSSSGSASVAIVCPAASGTASVGSSVNQGSSLSGSVSTSGSWSVLSALGNTVSPSSGNGSALFTYTGTNSGNDTLTFTFTNACGSSVKQSVNITVSVVQTPPTVTISADSTTVGGGGFTTLRISIGNAANTSQTTYAITSSRGNGIFPASGTGSGAKTASYGRDNTGGDDTITITVNAPNGSATASVVIH